MSRPATLLLCLALATPLLAQNPPPSLSVSFDVVSVKLHPPEPGPAGFSSNVTQRPDGGVTMTNVPAGPENAGPSVFVALPEQLGLKLDAWRTMVDSLIIDHLEKPTEN